MVTTGNVPIDPANAGQLAAWDGGEGAYWADHADRFDRSAGAFHDALMAAAAITRDEHVLDVGCGAGQTTLAAARAASGGSALGVDLSARMLDVARGRATAAGVTNASFEQADAQVHPFAPAAFDVAISRTGAMFFGDLVAAFTNIGRAMVPGGRLALVTWQPVGGNEWIREISGALAAGRDLPAPPPGAPGPFSLSEPERVHTVLAEAGFTTVDLEPLTGPMWFGTDADDAHRFVLGLMGWMLEPLDEAGRARATGNLHATMAAHESGDGVTFGASAWLIRATRA